MVVIRPLPPLDLRSTFDSNSRVSGRWLKIRLKRPAGNTGYFGTDPAHERSHSPDPDVLADIQFKSGIYPNAGGADELPLMERVDRETEELKHDFSEIGLVNSNANNIKRQIFSPPLWQRP